MTSQELSKEPRAVATKLAVSLKDKQMARLLSPSVSATEFSWRLADDWMVLAPPALLVEAIEI